MQAESRAAGDGRVGVGDTADDGPSAHRDTLLLMAWGDLSYEQVATALGVPVGTVRSRLSRARSKLRRALGEADPSAWQEETRP